MKFTKKLTTKQFIVSQLLILTFGLAFLFGLYYILNIQYQKENQPFLKGPVTTPPKTYKLDLDHPDDDSLIFQPSILVSGKTSFIKEVLIFTDSQDLVITSKKDGSFSTILDLDPGVNQITVAVFDSSGDSRSEQRTVYYAKEKLLGLLLLLIPNTVYAAESSPSADIKLKLEELKKQIASKAAKLKGEVNRKLQNKAYIGKVKSKSSNFLTLATRNGSKTVSINQDTIFESKIKSKKFTQSSISEENYIAGLGDVDETGVLTAKKIILLPPPSSKLKTFLWGQIVAISDKLVTLKDKNSKSMAVSLPKGAKVKVLDLVILTGALGKNDIFEAEFVYVIPPAQPKR